jgi:hypothetical protein
MTAMTNSPDRQAVEVLVSEPYELGQEFYRWEFATAVAGARRSPRRVAKPFGPCALWTPLAIPGHIGDELP